ncbi:secreted RxLR effector protein 161-like [Tripterygium wilfordii]|uniref:secreted RxLR effector protein 161-like n=1 Tax=Tripterygium wilfordii TaxID=458696 RepID=UPI0018F859EF|nr:secreted RxLR effector protein 161-like [Tripterygium wilfordii]
MIDSEPQTFNEAMSTPEAPFWKEAKLKADGSIDKYKARLVAKSFRQKEGLDYFDTYSPVTRITSIRMLIAIASLYELQIHQMDLEYSRVIGSLMYIMNCTRPDIAYSVSKLSMYTSNPGHEHWKALLRVLGYLNKTKENALHYGKYPAILEGYSDANWISDSEESKSTSGYVFTLGGAAISWKSSKQTCIARSTMESEFIALDKAGEEAEWLRHFLEDIPIWPKPVPAICIHCLHKQLAVQGISPLTS